MDTLIVFARAPQPGDAKTRLAADLGVNAAHRLYAAMFADTLDLAGRVPARRLLSLAGSAVPDLPPGWAVVRQPELSFGERLAWSFAQAFALGARRCVLIGADAPHLQPGWIAGAFAALSRDDVAIGPTHDGGYYLLGLREAAPWIFREVSWSTPAVFAQTLRLVREHGRGYHLLPETCDVDTLDDARRLYALLRREPARAPRTAAALDEVLLRASA
jgi:rSAM/selenodomain-associated transferase 1